MSRRALLGAGAAGIALAVLPGGCQSMGSVPNGPIAAGNVSDIGVGALMLISAGDVVLGRDAGGLYAMSAVCTHAGCVVRVGNADGAASGGLHCDCHNSSFDSSGNVTQGPARSPLPHYAVTVAADNSITIHGDQTVTSDARTAVA